DNSVAQYS
ncbi:hypothetical protein AVEN_269786-1, partial [Araneus ventricosus]